MKKIWCLLVCIATLLTMLSGCGSFFAEPTVEIANIASVTLADGQTKITISYKDPTLEPLEFIIPAGKAGETGTDGPGISSILPNHTGNKTEIIITYTDNRKETIFSIPDGMYAVGSEVKYDEENGQYYIEFTYSDGNTSEPFYIPTPEKGDGIKDHYTDVESEDDLYIYYVLEFDDGTTDIIQIPKGVGIAKIEKGYPTEGGTDEGEGEGENEAPENSTPGDYDENSGNYAITIYYTDGSVSTLEFQRTNQWYSGEGKPGDSMGIDGDYYLRKDNKTIYRKEDGSWEVFITFVDDTTTYKVTFDLNADGDDSAELNSSNGKNTYTFTNGQCFATTGYTGIPIPTRDGYIFDGWYTKMDPDPLVHGRFTDITPVTSDITLYAKWIPET